MKYTINRRTFTLTRRTLLRSSTYGVGTVMGLPLLEAMFKTDHAYAQAAVDTPRYVGMYVPNGIYHEPNSADGLWFPKYAENPTGRFIKRAIPSLMNSSLQGFEKHGLIDDITLIEGLQNDSNYLNSTGNGHLTGIASWMTGHAIMPHDNLRDSDMATKHRMSMEQEVSNYANSLLMPGVADQDLPNPDLMALRMAGSAHLDGGRMDYNNKMKNGLNWSKNFELLGLEGDLRKQYNALYSKPGMTGGQAGGGTQEIDRRTRLKLYVMDDVLDQLRSLERRLGVEDLQKVESYLNNVYDIEKSLNQMGTVVESSCDPSDMPFQPSEVPNYTFGNGKKLPDTQGAPHIGEHMRIASKITAHALSCGLIHSVSYCCGGEAAGARYTDINVNMHFHNNVSHNRKRKKEWMAIDKQHADHFALFMKEAKDIKRGDGDLLDGTAFMLGSGLGDGSKHSSHRVAMLIGGRIGRWSTGEFKHGQHFKYKSSGSEKEARGKDESHAQVVQTIREEMGIDPSTVVQPFTNKKWQKGELLNKGTLDFS